jgi:radical SAM superfamily enzyme YgiQ (UPF0313 family)
MDLVFLTGCIPPGTDDKKIYRPLGAYQTAWYLRNYGYDVQVIDFINRIPENEIYKALQKFITNETKILAYGAMVSVIAPETQIFLKKIERILKYVREHFPHVKIVAAGPAVTLLNRLYRNQSLFDYMLIGHAEDTMLALANHFVRNDPHPQFEKLDGNKIIRESFALPSKEKFDIQHCRHRWHKNDFIQPGESLPLELGRGCIFKCKFCQYPYIGKNKNDFTRNMDLVIEEIQHNYENWQTQNYYLLDDTFNADQDRLKLFSNAVQKLPFSIGYGAYLRIDLIHAHPESIELLKLSGLKGAYFGIETFNEDAAKLIGKSWIGKKGRDFLKTLYHDEWNKEVSVHTNFICGLPPERFEDYLETHEWLVETEIPHWNWAPLGINRDSHNEFTSEFDRNSEKYGFDWVLIDGKLQWKTDYCDGETAVKWRHQLNALKAGLIKPGCWDLIELGSFGVDLDWAMTQFRNDLPWEEIGKKRKSFLRSYWSALMNS